MLVQAGFILIVDFVDAAFHLTELVVNLLLPQENIPAKIVDFLQSITSKDFRDYLFPDLANVALEILFNQRLRLLLKIVEFYF